MVIPSFIVIGCLILGFGLISKRLQKSIFTPPMVFTIVGLLIGSPRLEILTLGLESEIVRILGELSFILILFTDSARIDLKILRHQYHLSTRLLGIGFPLTVVFGSLLALVCFPELGFWESVILSTVLAPTDAALGQAVINHPQIPVRIRQAINVESGLNDAIATVPIAVIFLVLSRTTAEPESIFSLLNLILKQIIFSPLVGTFIGYFGGKLVHFGGRNDWMDQDFQKLSGLSLSLLAYAFAELFGGNGFISVFCAGLSISTTSCPICKPIYEFAETEGQLLVLLIFTVFGAVAVWPYLPIVSWQILLYSVMSLTVVRIVAVAISLIGTQLKKETILFLGWFGPRGIASLLFGLLVLERVDAQGHNIIFTTVVLTVLMSIFVHGITALPGAQWYANRVRLLEQQAPVTESLPVSELPVRLPYK